MWMEWDGMASEYDDVSSLVSCLWMMFLFMFMFVCGYVDGWD